MARRLLPYRPGVKTFRLSGEALQWIGFVLVCLSSFSVTILQRCVLGLDREGAMAAVSEAMKPGGTAMGWATGAVFCSLLSTLAMYVIVGMNAFASVPEATVKAARIDGAGHIRVMFQVMLPQCLSLFVITVLNTFVGSWNSWISASIYVPFDRDKWPIQLWIQQMVQENQNFLQSANPDYNMYLIQFGVIVAAVLPILVMFPFFQKYLEAGSISGGVKE